MEIFSKNTLNMAGILYVWPRLIDHVMQLAEKHQWFGIMVLILAFQWAHQLHLSW